MTAESEGRVRLTRMAAMGGRVRPIDHACELLSIDWDSRRRCFVDPDGHHYSIETIKRLYRAALENSHED